MTQFDQNGRPVEAGASVVEAAERGYQNAVAWMAIKAGQNHYHETGDAKLAMTAGAGMFVRLQVWAYTFVGWWAAFTILVMGRSLDEVWFIRLSLIAIAPLAFGVTWVRNSDYALYRRGPFYRFWAPVALMVESIPTAVIYGATWLLILLAWFG